MSFNCILLLVFIGSVFCDFDGDEEHQRLHELAKEIMQNLQKDHLPNDGSNTGAYHHMSNIGENMVKTGLIGQTDKTKISVGMKGIKFVSVELNGKVVNISTAFGVGAVALYTVDKDSSNEEMSEDLDNYISEEAIEVIDDTLDSMKYNYLDECLTASPNETKIVLAQKSRFNMKVEPKGFDRPTLKVRVDQGYIVGAKTNITRGFTKRYYGGY